MNKINSRTNTTYKLISTFIAIITYMIYISSIELINQNDDYTIAVYILSLIGFLVGIFILVSWKKTTGKYFSLYTIFMLFFFLFNYGQCLMWALGIHMPDEIGKSNLYPGWGVASSSDILKTQLLTITSILMFHCGAILCFKGKLIINKKDKYDIEDNITLKIIFKVCFIISLVVIPITLYDTFKSLQIAQIHGYRALYYSDYARTGGTIGDILSRMFFPCIVGMLIGSKFSKNIRLYTYISFSLYLVLNMLAGDRGSWVYKIIILVWLSHTYYKKIRLMKLSIYVVISIGAMYVIDAMVSLRNIGITLDNIVEVLAIENSPIISTIFEMGTSMKPAIILQKYGWNIWPYNNSYILAMFTMVTNKVLQLLNIKVVTIGSWFSQEYLGISYGAGFSIIAESLMNFGTYFAPLALYAIGYFISSLIYLDIGTNYKNKPLRVFFAVSTLHSLLPLARGYFHYQLKDWFYGVLIIFFIIYGIKILNIKNNKVQKGDLTECINVKI